jgi:hypothetical protein
VAQKRSRTRMDKEFRLFDFSMLVFPWEAVDYSL